MRKTYRLSRIGAVQVAVVVGWFYFAIGVIIVCGSLLGELVGNSRVSLSAVAGTVVTPLLLGAMAGVLAFASCWVYNLIAARTGGIEWDLKEVGGQAEPLPAYPQPPPPATD